MKRSRWKQLIKYIRNAAKKEGDLHADQEENG
jgi:hypothetical protein